MKCIIIDDEPLALGIIKSYCNDMGGLEVMGAFNNPLQAIDSIQKEEVDLIFLDIEMPQITGLDFITAIDKKPLFIFTTAYPQYAIEGFELNAVDYLVKPIPFPRFIKAVNRAKELLKLKDTITNSGNISSATGAANTEHEFIFVKADYGNVKIRLEDIVYIQGLKDYLKIYVVNKKPILTLMNFRDIQEKLGRDYFFRVHRSFIVNIHKIESIQRSKIIIRDMRIPIGESYKESFLNRVGL